MTDIDWGPAIAVDGKRPKGLTQADTKRMLIVFQGGYERMPMVACDPLDQWSWEAIEAIRLPADHPHYRQPAQEKGLIVPAGMMPWHGGQKPTDWSGKAVMFRNGEIRYAPAGAIWKMGWDHSYGMGDIVAYSVDAPQADTKPDVTADDDATYAQMIEALLQAGNERRSITIGHKTAMTAAMAMKLAQDEPQASDIGITISPDVTARMEALEAFVDEVADIQPFDDRTTLDSVIAKAIALCRKPVDPDLIEARKLAAVWSQSQDVSHSHYLDGHMDDSAEVRGMVAALARGRELALAGETGK